MRRINRNKKENKMICVSKQQRWGFTWGFTCDECENNYYQVSVKKINIKIFGDAIHLLIAYELFFEDLIQFAQNEYKKVDILDFLQDSVENNHMLNDRLTRQHFTVSNDHIYTSINNNKVDYIHTGEFTIDNYKVNTSWSNMFFTNLTTNEQFMYYGD